MIWLNGVRILAVGIGKLDDGTYGKLRASEGDSVFYGACGCAEQGIKE